MRHLQINAMLSVLGNLRFNGRTMNCTARFAPGFPRTIPFISHIASFSFFSLDCATYYPTHPHLNYPPCAWKRIRGFLQWLHILSTIA